MSDLSFYALSEKPSLSLTDGANKLLSYGASWSSALGQSVTVSYGFRNSAPKGDDYTDAETSTFSKLDAAEIAAIRYALTAWSDVDHRLPIERKAEA